MVVMAGDCILRVHVSLFVSSQMSQAAQCDACSQPIFV